MFEGLYLSSWDTGIKTGYAIYETWDDCNLVDCGVCNPTGLQPLYEIFEKYPIGFLVAEKPQHYLANKSKGDPNNLTPLAIECGDLRGIAFCAGKRWEGTEYVDGIDMANVSLPLPSQWKRQLPKRVTMHDCKRVLSFQESLIAGPDTPHDKWDAIALGLYELNRLGFRRSWLR